MQGSSGVESDKREKADVEESIKERQSEATTKETVVDLEQSETDSGSSREREQRSFPSPDGLPEESVRDDNDAGPV